MYVYICTTHSSNKVRDDLKLGNDLETINSIFVEVDKSSAGLRLNLIIGCIYRPPWVPLAEFNYLLSTMLDFIVRENKIVFLLGDFNVNWSHNNDVEEFKNIFFSHHLFPLINKPTRETNHTATGIDNIFCNVPSPIRVQTGQGKVRENFISSRSGKSQ